MRKKKNSKLRSALAIFLAGAMVLGMIPGGMGQVYASDSTPTPAVAFDETSVSDPSTVDTWNQVVKDSTENIGRIWTDKTVLTEDIQLEGGSRPSVKKGDSDFLVGLSALSSTSNTVKTVSRPLDIVLVVDTSGSMENSPHMGTRPESERYRYEEIYAGNLSETEDQEYYTKDGGKITSEGQKILFWWEFTHWELNGQTVEPKISAEDSNPNHIQFYERRDLGTNITKLQALQNAVNNFVEQTAKMNDSIDDIKLQHRVSLVKFASDESDNIGNDFINNNYNRSQIVTELKSYTTKNISDLTSTVNSLIAAGATRADFGLNQAQRAFQLGGTREGAQKVVVFFTDGQPTSNSDWSNSVAAAAITNAKELKDANALIYSIGVFRDANPNDTNTSAGNFNGYMHAVSSNYPDATATSSTRPNRYSCTLGKRTDNSDYYKAATDADELNNIFNEISSDLETGFGFPTQTEGYDPGKVGYITFTDQLGEYMQVDEFKSLVFADQIFDPVGEPVTENGVTTYKYEGSATGDTELYPNGNVKDIIVQVKKGADLKTGDTVTVQIPAGLIPLRHFTLDTDSDGNKTMDIQEAYPLRIFYGVSIKPEVRERIADGLNPNDADDEALQQYLNAHNENGVPYFYSNYYNGQYIDPNGKTLGNTTASFQPAKKNTFYYFTEDTPIYTDKDCTMAVKNEPSADQTYYYKRPYVQLNGGQVEEIDGKVAFTGSNFQQASANFGINDKGEYFIKSGSARLTRIDALIDDKTENITNTADVVIDPIWDNINNPDYLNVYLGNNGRLALELPGALAISKDARVAANKNLNADEILKDKKFTFEISIPSMKGKTVKAEVRNAQNEIQGKAFELEFDKTGAAKYQIKDDETLYIHGLDKDAQYTVTEKELPKGFELTAVDKKADAKEAAGTIVSGKSVKHVFENTYDVDEITLAETDFASYEKQFDRWDIADKFRIELIPTTEGAPLPNGAADGKKGVEVTEKNSSGNFGEITFSHPGVYEYEIQEKQPASAIPGVIYSLASYTYRVTVTDNGDGTLSAVAEMEKTANDDGASVGNTPIPVENKTAVFVNDFHADSATTSILAKKVYADESGANPLKNGMFEFKLKATGDNAEQAPMPTGEKDENGYIHVVNVGTGITFGNMVFTEENVSDTPWTYEIAEVIPETAVNNGDGTYTLNGITYKAQTYSVSIMAKAQGSGEDAYIVIEKTYSKAEGAVAEDQIVFNNSYEPKPIVLPGEGESAVQGRKTLVGRDSLVDEEFSFTLSAANTAARTGLKENFIIFNGDTAQDTMQKTVNGLTNNQAATFDFDSIEFKRPGTYVFSVVENAPENGNGMVYDRHTARVRVIVTDENGELKAETAYYNGEGADTDAAAFVNLYTASATYGTGAELIVEKTLSRRALKAGEFTFKIEAADSDTVNAETADAKLSDSDREFTNTSGAADGVASRIFDKLSGVTFTQDDAGKTFSYVLSEAAGNLPGVTYSKDTYRFDITVVDNGDGTMHTETKVTMQGDGVTAEAHHDSSDGRDTIVAGFTNGYHADSVEVDFTEAAALFHKRLVGRDWKEDDSFTFNLTAEDGTPMPKDTEGNDVTSVTVSQKGGTEDGTDVPFGFGKVTYDTVGKYSYTVTEENAGQTINGVTYSKNEAKIIVDVSDPGNGQLTANIQSYSTIFINEYGASLNLGAAGGLAITKTVTGHALAKEQFEFKVKAVKTDTATADEAAELFGFKEGETEVTFKNNEAAADGQTVTMLKTDTNFTLKNLGKVYKYEVSEMNDKKPGYTYDDTVYTVELWVTDDGDGTLTLHTKVTDEKGSVISEETSNETDQKQTVLAFNNSYAGSGVLDGSANLAGTKKMDGPWEATDKDLSGFRFTITGGDEATNAAITAGTVVLPQSVTATSDADGNFNFGDITFNEKGTYKFTVSEVVPAEGDKIPGVAYNAETVTIIVNVTDNDDGTLTAALAEGSQELIFTNTYATTQDATFTPSVVKEVKGLNAKEIFTFKLSAADEVTKAAIDSGTLTGIGTTADLYSSEKTTTKLIPKDGTEQVDFNALTFKKAGTYKFTVQETNANAPTGWTYDSHTFDARVNESAETVVENKATIQIGENGPEYETDTDRKEIPKDGNLSISKTIVLTEGQGTGIDKEKEFTFIVALKDAKGTALTKEYAYAVTGESGEEIKKGNAADGTEISFQHGQKAVITGLPAGAQYTVTEKEVDGYTTTVNGNAGNAASGTITSNTTAEANFTNTYSVAGSLSGSEALKVTKELTGRKWLDTDTFSYTLTAADEATVEAIENGFITLPENAGGLEITKASAGHQAAFGDIQFTIAGTFKFNVTEQPSGIAGITDDQEAERTVVVKVTDKKNGTLEAAVVEGESENLTFINTYGAGTGDEDIAAKIEASKKLTGRDMKANEFRFEIVTRAAENPEGFKETFAAAGTNTEAAEGAEGAVKFAGNDGALTYTTESLDQAVKDGYAVKSENDDGSDVWTVSYTAREITDKLPGGVTAVEGKTSFDFTVVVTDRTDGTLTAQVQLPEGGIVFENAYTAEDTEVNTDPADAKSYFNKVLTGRGWLGTDEFTFTITPQDGAPAAEDAAADGTKTVTVTSDSAKAGEAVLFGFGKIRFTDEDMNGAAAGQDGTRTKEFRYTVKENPLPDGKMTGVTIDGHEATLKITVSDNLEGKLEVTNIASENGTFTNEYKSQLDYAAAGGLQITKALNGRDMEKDQFTFTVTPKATEGSTTAEEAAEKFGLANAANTYKNEAAEAGAVTTINVLDGKNVTFTQADAGKTFTYEAAETAGTNTAYTYDTDVRTVTVKVKDNNNSTLTVTTRVTKVKDGQEVIVDEQEVTTGEVGQKKATISFVNTYNDEPVELGGEGSVKINATKTLANRPLTDGEFTFRIFDKKGNPVVGKDAEATGTNAADGSITFAPVSYDTDRLMADVKAGIASVDKKSQAPAYVYTYDYTVTEDNPSGGVTGIATTFAIQVIVTDRGDGTLAIEVKYPDGKDSLPFENVYGKSANAEIALNGKKVYEKESVNAPDIAGKYTFTITGTDELGNPAPMPVKDGKVVTETTNDAAGNIDFGKLVYTMENVFGSAESQDEQTNANQDVEAGEDPADTNQNAEAGQDPAAADTAEDKTAAEDAADAAENAASEETAGDGTEGTKAPETDETDIEANGGSNAGSSGEDQDKEAAGAASADGGNVVDQAGTMNAQEAGQANRFSEPRTKVYTYRVTESGSMAGVTNDLAAAEGKTFTVTVTDNGDGTISAVSSWQNDFAFEFTNTYRVNPTDYSVNEHISIKKELTGRDLHEGEFTFELIDESGNVVASAVNEADGTVRFGALHYTEAGTYNYVIREAEGTAGGVQYDSAEHTVTVIVTDNGDGTLSAKAETKSGEDMNGIVFRNIYEARPASVTLGASKTYKGAELKDKQFTFVLKDKDGNVVFEAKNGADGQVMFETLIYDRAGVYEYTISEKNDGQKNVTYDETVYNVTITVTDNGKGNLIAEAVYGDGRTPQFVNTYVKPQNSVKPEQPTPTVKPQNPGAVQTGDHNSFAGTLGMAALALAVAAGVMIRRKKKS